VRHTFGPWAARPGGAALAPSREVEHCGIKEQAAVAAEKHRPPLRLGKQAMRRQSLTLIRVRTRPGLATLAEFATRPAQGSEAGNGAAPGTGPGLGCRPGVPGRKTRGILLAGRLAIPVILGRAGIKANKREGDG